MAKVKDCPGFETFGIDVQAARKAMRLTRKEMAGKVGIEQRYLANIELAGNIPSMPVVLKLIRLCQLPAERYFNPDVLRGESTAHHRAIQKLRLCPEEYLPIIEAAIDGALSIGKKEAIP